MLNYWSIRSLAKLRVLWRPNAGLRHYGPTRLGLYLITSTADNHIPIFKVLLNFSSVQTFDTHTHLTHLQIATPLFDRCVIKFSFYFSGVRICRPDDGEPPGGWIFRRRIPNGGPRHSQLRQGVRRGRCHVDPQIAYRLVLQVTFNFSELTQIHRNIHEPGRKSWGSHFRKFLGGWGKKISILFLTDLFKSQGYPKSTYSHYSTFPSCVLVILVFSENNLFQYLVYGVV